MNKHVKCLEKSHFRVLRVLGITVLLLLGLVVQNVSAETQQSGKSITGTVLDEMNEPVPGANVVVEGTTNGIMTDMDGNFSLNNVPENGTLSVSYVGYTTRKVKVAGKTHFEIKLSEDTQNLEEVVVVGYGAQKKVSVTGAIATVSPKELRKSTAVRLDNALAGRVTGLSSIQTGGGQPGVDAATLYLRGAATMNTKSPLVLVDGVERSDGIRTIDMNEVESFSVLKDASATAVFGVRGANGVIMITTRKGKKGKPQLSFSFDQSFTAFTKGYDHINSADFMELENLALANGGNPAKWTENIIDKYRNPLEGLDPSSADYAIEKKKRLYMYCDNDYYDMYIKDFTPQSRYNINISGGTDLVDYFLNGGYIHQGGNLNTESKDKLGYDPSAYMNRLSLRSNLDFHLSKSFTASLNVASYMEKINRPSAAVYGGDLDWMMQDLFYQAGALKPYLPGPTTISEFGIEDGALIDRTMDNYDRDTYEIMNRRGFSSQDKKNLNAQLNLKWDLSKLITQGLSLNALVAYDTYNTGFLNGTKIEATYKYAIDYDNNTLVYSPANTSVSELSLGRSRSSNYRVNFQGSVNYDRTFAGKHAVTAMINGNRQYWETTAAEIPYNIIGIASRVTYAYDDKYLVEGNLGYNGSEQFAPSKRFGLFPAGSLGWVVSNESFLKDNKVLTWLKLRASLGKVGNDQMGDNRFLFQDNITVGGGTSVGGLGGSTISEGTMGNTEITWETATKANYAIELGIIKDFKVTFDYFTEKRRDILISRQTIPSFPGLSGVPKVNMGSVDNRGYEIELSYNKAINKDISFSVKGNFGFNKNEIIENDEPQRTADYVYRYRQEGFSINQCWGYKIDWNSPGKGYFTSQEEINEYLGANGKPYGFGTPRVGDFVYIDQNGDGVVDEKDVVPIGYTSIPGITYGLTLSGNYKNFDFSVLFSGVGRYSMNYEATNVYEYFAGGSIFYSWHLNSWTEDRWQNGEKITYPALATGKTTSHTANDFFIMSRAFTRLKNIELGYTLPSNSLKAIGVSSLRFFVSGQNLFLWDNLRMDHLDPELNNAKNYPITKNITFGLNLNF